MTIMKNILNSIKNFSIRWKMLIPFLIFAFVGTATITLFDLKSQQNLIIKEENNLMTGHLREFQDLLKQKEDQALSIAVSIAENHEVGRLVASGDRQSLTQLLNSTYERLKNEFNVSQLNFYASSEAPFLIFHNPDNSSEYFLDNRLISYALSNGIASSCVKKGNAGLYIMGVTPVYHNTAIVGSLEICISLEKLFKGCCDIRGINTALYLLKGPGDYRLIAFSGDEPIGSLDEIYPDKKIDDSPKILIGPKDFPGKSIVTGPLKGCSDEIVALIELDVDRSEMLNKYIETGKIILTIAVIGIAVSFLLTYLVISFLTRPIREIAREAQDIAMGKREIRLEPRPRDEIGSLTVALNSMLDSLKNKQLKIEEYARTLETRVKERTIELFASEEKYRTLVENAPLIVYRVSRYGTTVFVNSYLTKNTGYTIEEAMTDRRFWRDKMAGIDQKAFDAVNNDCFHEGKPCRIESRVMAKDGRILTFITHAIPAKGPDGKVKWIDGIMMDITELKRLEEKTIQVEAIRTIGEISARIAHEIRNPLSAAGGFANRLKESLKNDDTNRKMAEIIVEEVARLENFLNILLSSIEPFELSLSEVNLNSILSYRIKDLDELLNSKNIRIVNDFETDLPKIRADHYRLSQSLGNILKHAIISTPDGETIFISTFWLEDQILITLTHRVDRVTARDMDKFFFPHVEHEMDESLLDLPLSKIIIHRHGGKIDLIKEDGDILILKIKLPILNFKNIDNSGLSA